MNDEFSPRGAVAVFHPEPEFSGNGREGETWSAPHLGGSEGEQQGRAAAPQVGFLQREGPALPFSAAVISPPIAGASPRSERDGSSKASGVGGVDFTGKAEWGMKNEEVGRKETLFVQCAWCRAWKVDGVYGRMVPLGAEAPGAKVSHGMCPECFVKMRAA